MESLYPPPDIGLGLCHHLNRWNMAGVIVSSQWARQGTGIDIKTKTAPVEHREAYSPDLSAPLSPVVGILWVEVCWGPSLGAPEGRAEAAESWDP